MLYRILYVMKIGKTEFSPTVRIGGEISLLSKLAMGSCSNHQWRSYTRAYQGTKLVCALVNYWTQGSSSIHYSRECHIF